MKMIWKILIKLDFRDWSNRFTQFKTSENKISKELIIKTILIDEQ